jgi:hypothetical protein
MAVIGVVEIAGILVAFREDSGKLGGSPDFKFEI